MANADPKEGASRTELKAMLAATDAPPRESRLVSQAAELATASARLAPFGPGHRDRNLAAAKRSSKSPNSTPLNNP